VHIHDLVVGHWKVDDLSGDRRADCDRACINECIISGFILEHVSPPNRARGNADAAIATMTVAYGRARIVSHHKFFRASTCDEMAC
jgi:hypothetical protein